MSLIIVPTPIGNLEDITLRALRELKEADLIACEDVRRTLKLLNHYGIKKPLISCHEHNERDRVTAFMEKLKQGQRIALVSDAGTPGISDPGEQLIHAAIQQGLEVDILPGPNALLPALLFSGLPSSPFAFVGFLKGKKGDRAEQLKPFVESPATLIVYVSPHRLAEQLQVIYEALGNRECSLSRELSKVYQETLRAPLKDLIERVAQRETKGEYVLVVAGSEPILQQEADWRGESEQLKGEGFSDKDIAKNISERYGISRNRIKQFLLGNIEEAENNGSR